MRWTKPLLCGPHWRRQQKLGAAQSLLALSAVASDVKAQQLGLSL